MSEYPVEEMKKKIEEVCGHLGVDMVVLSTVAEVEAYVPKEPAGDKEPREIIIVGSVAHTNPDAVRHLLDKLRGNSSDILVMEENIPSKPSFPKNFNYYGEMPRMGKGEKRRQRAFDRKQYGKGNWR